MSIKILFEFKMNNKITKHRLQLCPIRQNSVDGNGLILIADISGFTKFVQETDALVGSKITQMLLSSIVDSNILNLKVNEIEGDAIFFYKYGNLPSICSILKQYEVMLGNFNNKLHKIRTQFKTQLDLSLKVIVHVGKMTQFSIGKFNKLYGTSVIEAHRLLKNPIPSKSYVLLTDELIKTVIHHTNDDDCVQTNAKMLSEKYDKKSMEFTYYDYQDQNTPVSHLKHGCNKGFKPLTHIQ